MHEAHKLSKVKASESVFTLLQFEEQLVAIENSLLLSEVVLGDLSERVDVLRPFVMEMREELVREVCLDDLLLQDIA